MRAYSIKPLISVVVPVYNQRAVFLSACLKSVLAQSFSDFELVVSDNHSTNDTRDVIASFNDPRIRVVKPPQHLKLVPHFAFAAQQIKGPFISFLSSDDIVEPHWLQSLVPALQDNEGAVFAFGEIAGVAHTNTDHILYLCRNKKMPSGTLSPDQLLELIIPLTRTAAWLVGDVIRSDAYFATGGMAQQGVIYGGDHALALKLLELGSAVYVNKLVGRHRVWRASDGKQDAERSLQAIDDVTSLYRLMDDNAVLKKDPDRYRPLIAQAKTRKSRLLALSLLSRNGESQLTSAQYAVFREKILHLDSNVATKAILALGAVAGVRRLSAAAMPSLRRALRAASHP